jgi:predicted Zn-ribbon and HTH transcriptional regulator
MARYFVSLGNENPSGDKREKRLEKKLESLANNVSGEDFGHFSYVTQNLEKVKEVAKKAVEAYRECGFEDRADVVDITTLPECPRCGYRGSSGDSYCSRCGTELTKWQKIDTGQ